MAAIERMTMGHIVRGGVDPARLPLLLRDALRRRGWARRVLERAAGQELHVVLPRDAAPCPLEHVNHDRTRHGVLVARVPLGGDLAWEDDTLHGTLPDSMRLAAIGRPLGEVLGHPDVDPEAITTKPRDGGLLSVPRMTVELPESGMRDRLAHLRLRLDSLRLEARLPIRAPRRLVWLAAGMATMVLLVAAWRTCTGTGGVADVAANCGLWLAGCHNVWLACNLRRAEPFSLLHAMLADQRHRAEICR